MIYLAGKDDLALGSIDHLDGDIELRAEKEEEK